MPSPLIVPSSAHRTLAPRKARGEGGRRPGEGCDGIKNLSEQNCEQSPMEGRQKTLRPATDRPLTKKSTGKASGTPRTVLGSTQVVPRCFCRPSRAQSRKIAVRIQGLHPWLPRNCVCWKLVLEAGVGGT
jgi:hypothetical protein